MRNIEGNLSAEDIKFAIVVGRFNSLITEKLLEGAIDCILRHGGEKKNITVARVPGSFEIPLTAKKLAKTGDYDAVICLGAVIRGSTPHFDYVANEVSKGIATVSLETEIPISFGVLTTDTIEQAVERAGTKMGNKGFDAALSAIEMVNVLKNIGWFMSKYKKRARELVFRVLYTSDITGKSIEDVYLEYLNRLKGQLSPKTVEYSNEIIKNLKNHTKEIDEIISKNLKNWRLERLGYPEKALLRLGTYELLFEPVKAKGRIFIDILDLTNCYLSSKESIKFINGILNSIYKNYKQSQLAGSSNSWCLNILPSFI